MKKNTRTLLFLAALYVAANGAGLWWGIDAYQDYQEKVAERRRAEEALMWQQAIDEESKRPRNINDHWFFLSNFDSFDSSRKETQILQPASASVDLDCPAEIDVPFEERELRRLLMQAPRDVECEAKENGDDRQ